MTEWFILKNGEKHGPVTASALKILAANGTLRPEDKVWREGLKDWKTAGKVIGLFPSIRTDQANTSPPNLPADGCPETGTIDPTGKLNKEKALPQEGETDYLSKFLSSFTDPSRIEQALNAFSTKYSGTDASESNESESGLQKRENQVPVKYAVLGCLASTAIIVLVVVGISLLVSERKLSLTIPNVADGGALKSFEDTPPPILEAHKLGYKVLLLEGIPEQPTTAVGRALLGKAIYCIFDKNQKVLVIHKYEEGNQAWWVDSNSMPDLYKIPMPHMNIIHEWSLDGNDASVLILVHKLELYDDKIRVENRYTFTINTAANMWKLDHTRHLSHETKEFGAKDSANTLGTGKASWHR